MKRMNILVLLFLVGLWIAPSPTSAQDNLCSAVVQNALAATANACDATGRNQACYGNVRLQAVTRPGFDNIRFTQQGDLADVAAISTVALSSLDADAGEWGVALMRIQANLPDTLPGQNVLFLLFGDVEIENAVPSNTEPVRINITAEGNINIRSGPSTDDEIIGALVSGEALLASGRLADGSWLQVDLPDSRVGWVSAPLVTTDGDISLLNVVEPSAATLQYRPMQAFYFRSGVGDAPCEAAPDSGILIQTPEGVGRISLLVNEVDIQLGSTAFLQAQPSREMVIYAIDGFARAEALGKAVATPEGGQLRVPLDDDLKPAAPPIGPESYTEDDVRSLPVANLEQTTTVAPPLSEEVVRLLTEGAPIPGMWAVVGPYTGRNCPVNPSREPALQVSPDGAVIGSPDLSYARREPSKYVWDYGRGTWTLTVLSPDYIEVVNSDGCVGFWQLAEVRLDWITNFDAPE